jgi:hypothetical protein
VYAVIRFKYYRIYKKIKNFQFQSSNNIKLDCKSVIRESLFACVYICLKCWFSSSSRRRTPRSISRQRHRDSESQPTSRLRYQDDNNETVSDVTNAATRVQSTPNQKEGRKEDATPHGSNYIARVNADVATQLQPPVTTQHQQRSTKG